MTDAGAVPFNAPGGAAREAGVLVGDDEDLAGAGDFASKSSDLGVLRARIQALMRRKFFQDESDRIVAELKARELETHQAYAGRHIADARVVMAEKLVQACTICTYLEMQAVKLLSSS